MSCRLAANETLFTFVLFCLFACPLGSKLGSAETLVVGVSRPGEHKRWYGNRVVHQSLAATGRRFLRSGIYVSRPLRRQRYSHLEFASFGNESEHVSGARRRG